MHLSSLVATTSSTAGVTAAVIAEAFAVEVGPGLAMIAATFITSVAGVITVVWQGRNNRVKTEEIHKVVNSTAKELAEKLARTEAALLDVTRRLAANEGAATVKVVAEPKQSELKEPTVE